MEIKIIEKQKDKSVIQCGCGNIRVVNNRNLWKLKYQKRCNCKKNKKKDEFVVEKVPMVSIKPRTNPKDGLHHMGFSLVRYKTDRPLVEDYTLFVCKDGRLVFEGCEKKIGNFADLWADPKNKRVALQSSVTGDVKFHKNYTVNRKELAWTVPKVTYKVKGRYIPSLQAVVFQL